MLRQIVSQLGFRRMTSALITDDPPKTSAYTNTTKRTGTGAVVVRTLRRPTQRSTTLYSLDAQLYGIEVEIRNKQVNKCCNAYHFGGTNLGASAVRRYSNNRINTGRVFLAEAHLDTTLTLIILLIPF